MAAFWSVEKDAKRTAELAPCFMICMSAITPHKAATCEPGEKTHSRTETAIYTAKAL